MLWKAIHTRLQTVLFPSAKTPEAAPLTLPCSLVPPQYKVLIRVNLDAEPRLLVVLHLLPKGKGQ